VTVTGEAPSADPVARRSRGASGFWPDRITWPIWAFTAGMPFAFMGGLHGMVWCLPGIVLGSRIIKGRRTVQFPMSSIPLVLFVGWALLSASVISTGSGYILFGYRWLLFAGALASLVWIVNLPEEKVSTKQIVDWLAWLWIFLVIFGYAGIALPRFAMKSPFQLMLGSAGNRGFTTEITSWRLAETQGFLGYALPRPAAPFGGTNGWGAAMGILTPFFIRSWIIDANAGRRRMGYVIGAVALYPIAISVNRGLWISLGVGLIYYASRKALRGKFGPVALLGGVMVALVLALVFTPLGGLVADRLNSDGTTRSNDSRADLYHRAYEGAKTSPLIGNGTPERAPDAPKGEPPVGTHGLIWYLMYVHGFVGLGLFMTWLLVEVIRSGRVRRSSTWWTHLSLLMALVEVPFYGLLPQVVIFGVAAGLAHREDRV
jgi:hypothetical protein